MRSRTTHQTWSIPRRFETPDYAFISEDESEEDAVTRGRDEGGTASPRKTARLKLTTAASGQDGALLEERHEVVEETSTVKKVLEDVGKLPEFNMRIKKKQQPEIAQKCICRPESQRLLARWAFARPGPWT